MPTGYTAGVEDGSVTEFKEFAVRCARAFGANIELRDSGYDVPIPVYLPSTYHVDALKDAEKKLKEACALTVPQCRKLLEASKAAAIKDLERRRKEMAAKETRYREMLLKVEMWRPPTPDHDGMKKFMVQQLKESIEHDCYDPGKYYHEGPSDPEEYRLEEIGHAQRQVDYHTTEMEKEHQRTKEKNAWNKALFESLK